jgi:hypothetical protein
MNARRVLAALAAGVALATATPHALSADITGLPPAGVGMRRGDTPDTTVTGEIAGVVRNVASGQPIAFANVIVIGTKLGTMTDEKGHYSIVRVPAGARSILVQCIGFERERRDVLVAPHQTVDVPVVVREPDVAPIVAFETPDSLILDVVRRAHYVRVYRLDPSRERERAAGDAFVPQREPERLGGAWIATEIPAPSNGWTRQFKALLANTSTYRSGLAPLEPCHPAVELGVTFRSGEDIVSVELSPSCGRVQFQSTVAPTSRGTIGPGGTPLLDLVRQALAAPSEYSWTGKPYGVIYGRVEYGPGSPGSLQAVELVPAGLRTVTDDRGRFAFAHVPVGTWQVKCESTAVSVVVRSDEVSRPHIVLPLLKGTTIHEILAPLPNGPTDPDIAIPGRNP